MPDNLETNEHNGLIRMLLITQDKLRAELLTRMITERGLQAVLDVMRPSQQAVACARRTGRFSHGGRSDLIVIDLSTIDDSLRSVLADITFGSDRVATPTVLLTDEQSELALSSGELQTGNSIMFAPTSLPSFLGKMQEHSRSTFLQALSKLSGIGPILVRLPGYFTHELDDVPQQHIGLIAA